MTNRVLIILSLSFFLAVACSLPSFEIRRAELLYKEGQSLASEGREEEAVVRFQKSLSLSRKAGFHVGVAHNLNEMAIIHTAKGEYVRARELLAEAVHIYKEAKMGPEVSKALNNIALTYAREGEFREALRRYEALLDWDRQTNNRLGEAITLNNMGLIYDRFMGRQEEAQRCYREALKIFKELGYKDYIQTVEKNMLRD